MRWALGLGLTVLGTVVACGGDAGVAITAAPVNVSVSSFSSHDPSKSSATIAVQFRPSPSAGDELALEVIDRDTEDVVASLPLDRSGERDLCLGAERDASWETFTIRGESADELQLDSDRHELRLTIKRDSQEKHFLLDIPDIRCGAIE